MAITSNYMKYILILTLLASFFTSSKIFAEQNIDEEIKTQENIATNGSADDKYKMGKMFDYGGKYSSHHDHKQKKKNWYLLAA